MQSGSLSIAKRSSIGEMVGISAVNTGVGSYKGTMT